MFKFILVILLSMVSQQSYNQQPSKLPGKWKMIAITEGDNYFNFKTDSLHLAKPKEGEFKPPELKKEGLMAVKQIYGRSQYHFGSDGSLKMMVFDTVLLSTGRYIESILDSEYDSVNMEKGVEIKRTQRFVIKNDLLYLLGKRPDSPTFILERLKDK